MLDTYLQGLRTHYARCTIPDFDPNNGNENAKFLFVLEAPGPLAMETGVVSYDNPDQTARNFRDQLHEACIRREDIAIWNLVPWYVGDEDRRQIRPVQRDEVAAGIGHLLELLLLLPKLQCVVLVGGIARKAHLALSSATTARILTSHHSSARAMTAARYAENVAIFKNLQAKT